MPAAVGRVDLLVKKLDNTIVMLGVAARVEELFPSIYKLSCSQAKEGRFIRENQTNPTSTRDRLVTFPKSTDSFSLSTSVDVETEEPRCNSV
jgi:hypothetical protein